MLSVLGHCWFGGRKRIWLKKKLTWYVVGCDLTSALHILVPVYTTSTSIISCCSKIQWFDILIPAYSGCPRNGH